MSILMHILQKLFIITALKSDKSWNSLLELLLTFFFFNLIGYLNINLNSFSFYLFKIFIYFFSFSLRNTKFLEICSLFNPFYECFTIFLIFFIYRN